MKKGNFKTDYGYFSEDGKEYVITRPDTPKPWINVICNGNYGFVVSQTGSGFSWRGNSNLFRLTRWNQDLVTDEFRSERGALKILFCGLDLFGQFNFIFPRKQRN